MISDPSNAPTNAWESSCRAPEAAAESGGELDGQDDPG